MRTTIGQKFEILRKQAGKTEAELAAYLKMNVETYRKHEDDFIYPNDNQITRLGKFYGMTYNEVIATGED
ncbi:helix-turn-helix domain-containing protein [Pedobacter africanus]|uniref:HTH cro/C1-type domain-containing protein n=1 Tax=Pedobacter africanus TaxID=151894 RepID=A0A1W2CTY7_9SPHI|nr:helix-turn-helix transcriptional regulator [Pedobacter africanus]SMC88690.1 hypothetical protein SAMN04488524_3222 [Pedobacter africanus]